MGRKLQDEPPVSRPLGRVWSECVSALPLHRLHSIDFGPSLQAVHMNSVERCPVQEFVVGGAVARRQHDVPPHQVHVESFLGFVAIASHLQYFGAFD